MVSNIMSKDVTKRYGKGVIGSDLLSLFIGERIGKGSTREVYEHYSDPSLVIKIEDNAHSFCNVHEYQMWEDLEFTNTARFLAPIDFISPCGTVIIQKKTTPVGNRKLPKGLPKFFTDLKKENWGIYKNRVVCHDYGYTVMGSRDFDEYKTIPKWWD